MKNENVPATELSETTTAPTVEEVNSHEKGIVNRRSFMRHSLVAGAAATVGAGLLANGNFAVAQGASGKLRKEMLPSCSPWRSRDHRKCLWLQY
jgi:TAT (twin-arginine translocation) pathway signal sequence